MESLLQYFITITPGIVMAGVLFWFFRNGNKLIHTILFIAIFIFTRDAMTPFGLWQIGGDGFLWIRFMADPLVLTVLALSSLGFVILMQFISPKLAEGIEWFTDSKVKGSLLGVAGAIVVVLPLVMYHSAAVPLAERGGAVDSYLLPFVLMIALLGNLFEEVLFRGYTYDYLTSDEKMSPLKAAVLSGLLFSFGHIFLAFNVSTVGLPILIFAFWEGSIAGIVRSKFGVIPATLTHGLAIFIITSGLF